MSPAEAIHYMRKHDCDFLTVENVQDYSGCTVSDAREALREIMGTDWVELQERP